VVTYPLTSHTQIINRALTITVIPDPHMIEKLIDIMDLNRLFKQHETVDAEKANVFDEDEDGKI
jgi:hypothetical protein